MFNFDSSLRDHNLNHMEVIDCLNNKFNGAELNKDQRMSTKKGTRIVSVAPLLSHERYSQRNARMVTVKSELGDRVKMRQVCTVEELRLILKDELGMNVIFKPNHF